MLTSCITFYSAYKSSYLTHGFLQEPTPPRPSPGEGAKPLDFSLPLGRVGVGLAFYTNILKVSCNLHVIPSHEYSYLTHGFLVEQTFLSVANLRQECLSHRKIELASFACDLSHGYLFERI